MAALAAQLLDPSFAEPESIYAERLARCPSGCHVLATAQGIVGYAISHPWLRASPPPLRQPLGALPAQPDCWYIHDVGVAPGQRGGTSSAILAHLETIAHEAGLRVMALVAVDGAQGFWQKQGYQPAMTPALTHALQCYGDDAVYMEKPLRSAAY